MIGPLFLDDLRDELTKILGRIKETQKKLTKDQNDKLCAFQEKIASLTFLDPACGSGNFLIVSYRELKRLEFETVKALHRFDDHSRSLWDDWKLEASKVSINQFYGIEIEEFPVEVARVSMWLMEHVMNVEFGKFFGATIPTIPLKDSAHIVCANALTTDWKNIVPVETLSYIMGNPPFNGSTTMSKSQKDEVTAIFAGVKKAASLDFVTAWYKKAADLFQSNNKIECAFVSTNSICQGEQVAPLWKTLFNVGVHINFAHQTFQWRNEAKDNAGVYCVVIGFGKKERNEKKLYCYETVKVEPSTRIVKAINGYLIDGNPLTMVDASSQAINGAKAMARGNQPTDGGTLIIEAEDYESFYSDIEVRPYIKKLIGAKEMLHNFQRYCLWLTSISLEEALSIPKIRERVLKCREFRLGEKTSDIAKENARTPHLFIQRTQPENCSCIVIPCHSSERRDYIPMRFVGTESIVTNANQIVPNGTLYDFGILESRMHMTWMRTVCGRLKSDYRYSRDLCYNTFPWPDAMETQRQRIEILAQNVLDARDLYPELTLADLYDPDKMPPELKAAHEHLDRAVDQLYRAKAFENDEERLQMLFEKYEKLVASAKEETAKKGKSK